MSSVYFYAGHGTDMCDKKGNLIIERVPKDCIYVTVSICGINTFHDYQQLKAIISPAALDIFKDPLKNKKYVGRLLGISEADIHIHLPNDTFVNNLFSPVSYFQKKDGGVKMSLSGILSDQDIRTKPIDESLLKLTTYDNTGIPIPEFLKYFQGVPTAGVVTSKLSKTAVVNDKISIPEIEDIGDRLSIDANNAMRTLSPGVHYNLVCRSADSCKKESVMLRRATSASRQRTWKNTLERMVAHGEDYDAIKTFLQDNKQDLVTSLKPTDIKRIVYSLRSDEPVRQLLEDFKTSITNSNHPPSTSSSTVALAPAPTPAPTPSSLQPRHLDLISRIREKNERQIELNIELSNLSKEPGFQIDLQDAVGDTLLIAASRKGHTELIKALCRLGADFNLENKAGKSALDVAPVIAKGMLLSACKRKTGGRTRRRRKLTRRTRKRT